MVDKADAVYAMCEVPLPDYLEHSPKLTRWSDIPDAKGTDLPFHRTVRDQIKEKVKKITNS